MAELIYQTGFEYSSLKPQTDKKHLRYLKLKQGSLAAPPTEMVPEPPGLTCKLRRETPSDPVADNLICVTPDHCYVEAFVHPFPKDIRFFKVRATFELPACDITEPGYRWVMMVFARKGDENYSPTRNQRTIVTLQSRMDNDIRSARMNTPCGAAPGMEPGLAGTGVGNSIPGPVYEAIFESNDVARSRFTLELLVDRVGGIARASFEFNRPDRPPPEISRWSSFIERRWFVHPLVSWDEGEIESVGFGLANARGLGTVSARVRDFRIYELTVIDMWLLRFQEWIAKLLR